MTGVRVVREDEPQDAPADSPLAELRRAAARQRGDRHLDQPVGGAFGTRLVIRYGVLPIEQADRYVELRQAGALARISELSIDMMATACRTVLWEGTDLHVRLNGELWQLLDWPLPPETDYSDITAREVIMKLFGDNGIAVVSHADRLGDWMQDPREDPQPGESSATTS